MTTIPRTLVDCARTLPFREALVVVDAALRRKTLARAAALEAGAPAPELQHPIALSSEDSSGIALADLAWPTYRGRAVKVIVEHDGFDAHGVRRETFDRDRERWNALQDEGWTLRIFTYRSVRDRYERTGTRIMQTLEWRHREVLPLRPA